jgi:hypothetical protein
VFKSSLYHNDLDKAIDIARDIVVRWYEIPDSPDEEIVNEDEVSMA